MNNESNESGREPFDPHEKVKEFMEKRYAEHDAKLSRGCLTKLEHEDLVRKIREIGVPKKD